MKVKETKPLEPALPLSNKRRELFCSLYAGDCWGRPGDALLAAGYKPKPGLEAKAAKKLLEEPDVAARVKLLRERKAELSVADPAWIKDHFVEIATKASKDSDKLKALSGLQKALAPPAAKRGAASSPQEQPELPLFEGGDDGV